MIEKKKHRESSPQEKASPYVAPGNWYALKTTKKEDLLAWYRLLILGRMIDERAPNYLKQALGWSYHAPYAGHDGIQLALGQLFDRQTDHLFPYYRDMLTALSSGLSVDEILLNGLSKRDDIASGGRHMSNHFAKPAWNIHNVSSCTGNHTLHATGLARAIKTYRRSGVVFSSQGESSLSEGYCYEAINGASREKLPVVFVIQDNGFGISVPKSDQTAQEKYADNFSGFLNLRIIHCDGKDIFDSMNAMKTAKEIALKESLPVLVHALCVRIHSHSNSDKHELYRSEEELKLAKDQDPLPRFKSQLLQHPNIQESELLAIEKAAKEELLQAHQRVLQAPNPDPESIHDFVIPPFYVAPSVSTSSQAYMQEGEEIKFIDAINLTLKEEFRRNPDTYIWGQDVAHKEKGGIFNVTKGMQQEFGPSRVFNGPIAEDFILGTANGFSRLDPKIRVVVEGAEFADYFWPAMEQLIECSHDYWRTNGQFTPNITIRIASGGYIGGGLYHSQNIEASLTPIPGIRVVVPAFADDAAGLLRTAMRSQGPTVYLEPKALYNAKQAMSQVPVDYTVPFGQAKLRRAGHQLGIITYGNTVHQALEVAEQWHRNRGVEVAVLDLRSLAPLDTASIIELVKATSKVLVLHEDKVFAGFGGEIVSLIQEHAFQYLDAPVMRLGSTFTPVGFNRILEKAILPDTAKIDQVLEKLFHY